MDQGTPYRNGEGHIEKVEFVVGQNNRVKITLEAHILHGQEVSDSAEAIRDALPIMAGELEDKLGIKHPTGIKIGTPVKLVKGTLVGYGVILEMKSDRIILQSLAFGELNVQSWPIDDTVIVTLPGRGMEAVVGARMLELSKGIWNNEFVHIKDECILELIANNAPEEWNKLQAIGRMRDSEKLKGILSARLRRYSNEENALSVDALYRAASERLLALKKT
ncbi:MAG: hypothetical protein WCW31_02005 [Patescibacteria group bacterium]